MKYLSSLLTGGALLLATVAPSFAFWMPPMPTKPTGATVKNNAVIYSSANSGANTGFNVVNAGSGFNTILTGQAGATSASLVNGVNYVDVGSVKTVTNNAVVNSTSGALSNTGNNVVNSISMPTMWFHTTPSVNTISTGIAGAESYSTVTNVNSTL